MKSLITFITVTAGILLAVAGVVKGNLLLGGFGIALPFLTLCFTFPLLRRLAIRNASRRPRETLLILVGTLLGTAIITSSGVVGDTFAASDRETISTQLGPVDEAVELPTESRTAVEDYLAKHPNTNIDGILTVAIAQASVGSSGTKPLALPDAQIIEMPFDKAKVFGGKSGETGIEGASPLPGTATITQDVANGLKVKAGSPIDLYVFGKKQTLNIDHIIPTKGLAGLNLYQSSGHSYNVFVAPNTLSELAAHNENADFGYTTLISNTGDVFGGAIHSEDVAKDIQTNVLDKIQNNKPSSDTFNYVTSEHSGIETVKQQRIKDAKQVGKIFRRLFMAIGSFTIIAGVLLLINIFTMLAQERQSELGLLRAMGLRRRSLIVAFSLEGFVYAIGSALLGTIFGVLIGRIVAFVASGIFSTPELGIKLSFHATFESIERGFVGGLGISMLTVVLASLFIARMNVIRAIRDLPDPGIHRKRTLGLLIGLFFLIAGFGLTFVGIQKANEFLALSGPDLLAIGAIMVLRRWIPTKTIVTTASATIIAWSIFGFTIAKHAFAHANAAVYVIQGIQLTAFAVIFISANQERIGSVVRIFGRGTWSMALRLGLAYPLARRGRTGLLLAMYSLVIFVLTFIMTISNTLTKSVENHVAAQSRGSDIELSTKHEFSPSSFNATPKTITLPIDDIAKNPDIQSISAIGSADALLEKPNSEERSYVQVHTFDNAFIGNGAPALKERLPQYKSDDDAFRDVAANKDLIIVQNSLVTNKDSAKVIHPGTKVSLLPPPSAEELTFDSNNPPAQRKQTTPKVFTIAAVSRGGVDVLMSPTGLETVVPATDIRHEDAFVKVKNGVDATQLANQLSGLYVGDHIEAHAIHDEIEQAFSLAKQFLMLIQGYMAIGLFVGIAGLGVVMVRAVRERRRQIGMLRAMGFPAHSVRRAFLAEAAFIAGEGILIGAILALVVLNRTFSTLPADVGLSLAVPWVQLISLIAITFAASILATAAPAQAASRIPPAVALRITD